MRRSGQDGPVVRKKRTLLGILLTCLFRGYFAFFGIRTTRIETLRALFHGT
jgi:hypothetical protein